MRENLKYLSMRHNLNKTKVIILLKVPKSDKIVENKIKFLTQSPPS